MAHVQQLAARHSDVRFSMCCGRSGWDWRRRPTWPTIWRVAPTLGDNTHRGGDCCRRWSSTASGTRRFKVLRNAPPRAMPQRRPDTRHTLRCPAKSAGKIAMCGLKLAACSGQGCGLGALPRNHKVKRCRQRGAAKAAAHTAQLAASSQRLSIAFPIPSGSGPPHGASWTNSSRQPTP